MSLGYSGVVAMYSSDLYAEIGRTFAANFEVRYGPSLLADVILPGPPISWAFLVVSTRRI
jgi:hypothetical protein